MDEPRVRHRRGAEVQIAKRGQPAQGEESPVSHPLAPPEVEPPQAVDFPQPDQVGVAKSLAAHDQVAEATESVQLAERVVPALVTLIPRPRRGEVDGDPLTGVADAEKERDLFWVPPA